MAGCPDVDTIDPMVVPDPVGDAPSIEPSERSVPLPLWQRFWWVLPIGVAVLTMSVVLNTTLPYYAIAPGDAPEVDALIRAPEDRLYPSAGEIYLATVSLGRVKPLEALQGWLDGDTDVVPEEQILGRTPPKEYRQQNLQLMDDSKQTALVVALRQIGHHVPERGKGALITQVSPKSPAEGRFEPGDTITGIDGVKVELLQQAVERIRSHKPGDTARVEVLNANGVTRVEEVTLSPSEEGHAFLGVVMRTRDRTFDLPFDVSIESGLIGGPSAGLAFVLGLVEELLPGELTGGQRVAVTGTIDIDGTVGDVGGVAQKTAAVRAKGAKYFLVPPGEYEIAKAHAGKSLTVVKVATLDEAIDALGRLGGDITGARRGT
jgi:PDZ domain-containing protein